MSRSGKPPQHAIECQCRDGKPALAERIFCADHELLWIANSGAQSHKLKRKYKKLYAQFLKMYRVHSIYHDDMFNIQGTNWVQKMTQDLEQIKQDMRSISGVQPATLRSSSKGLERDPSGSDK